MISRKSMPPIMKPKKFYPHTVMWVHRKNLLEDQVKGK